MGNKKILFEPLRQLGFMISIPPYYKGERHIVISLPFVDVCFHQIEKKYRVNEHRKTK